MGLNLKNPVVVASSSLTNSLENVKKCEASGAGAVVLKSLFEEQIYAEKINIAEAGLSANYHSEAYEYIQQSSLNLAPESYLKLIADCKKEVKIPIIASLNCISDESWTEFAKRIEKAGADALELNISFITKDYYYTSEEIEQKYINIVRAVRKEIKIPIAVKIGPVFTSIARMARKFSDAGANAIVIFTRFYQIDIDTDKMEIESGYKLSSHSDTPLAIRWVSMLANRVDCDIAGSRGVLNGNDIVKHLLAGANAVQVCSALYMNKVEYLSLMIGDVEKWMKEKNFNSISEFRGLLSQKMSQNPEIYEREQYIKAVVGVE